MNRKGIIFIIDDDRKYVNDLLENLEFEFEDKIEVIAITKNFNKVFENNKFTNADIFYVDRNIFNGKGSSNSISREQIDGVELAKKIKSMNNSAMVLLNSGDDDIENIVDELNLESDFDENKVLGVSKKNIESIVLNIKRFLG